MRDLLELRRKAASHLKRIACSLPSIVCAVLALAAMACPTEAFACGVSGPDGVWSCSLEEHEEELRPRWHVGASGLYTVTTLNFGNGLRGDQQRAAALASLTYAPTRRFTLQASAGAAFGGVLTVKDGRHDFDPGPSAALGVSWRALEGRPFLALTSLLSFSAARTHGVGAASGSAGYEALDLRLGALFGTTLFETLSPYAVARVFGGPVFWRYQGSAVTGTDVSHFQLGLGLAWLIARRIDLFAEGIPLGERAVSGGAAVAF
jgi:hypothetical protein